MATQADKNPLNFLTKPVKYLSEKVKWLPIDERLVFLIFLASTIIFVATIFFEENRITVVVLYMIFVILIFAINIINKFVTKLIEKVEKIEKKSKSTEIHK